jgi:hypothetical protein
MFLRIGVCAEVRELTKVPGIPAMQLRCCLLGFLPLDSASLEGKRLENYLVKSVLQKQILERTYGGGTLTKNSCASNSCSYYSAVAISLRTDFPLVFYPVWDFGGAEYIQISGRVYINSNLIVSRRRSRAKAQRNPFRNAAALCAFAPLREKSS